MPRRLNTKLEKEKIKWILKNTVVSILNYISRNTDPTHESENNILVNELLYQWKAVDGDSFYKFDVQKCHTIISKLITSADFIDAGLTILGWTLDGSSLPPLQSSEEIPCMSLVQTYVTYLGDWFFGELEHFESDPFLSCLTPKEPCATI